MLKRGRASSSEVLNFAVEHVTRKV